jgi:hypothetical protein
VNLEIESSILRGLVPLTSVTPIDSAVAASPAPVPAEEEPASRSIAVPLESFQDY